MSTIAVRATHPSYLDDEIVALTLQMDEINYREETKKAKYPIDEVPDLELAYSSYLTEIEAHLTFLRDVKLAHSIANAVDTDAVVIAEITHGDQQAQDDHCVAVQMSTDDPELEKPPPYTQQVRNDYIEDEIVRRLATMLTTEDDVYEDPQVEAGPSVPYARRQAVALEKLALEVFECTGCASEFRWTSTTQLSCGHGYCEPCLRKFIMAGVVDRELMLVPPRCCSIPVPFGVIASTLTEAEMDDFQHAELEKATKNKTYCSNPDCGRFITPNDIVAGEATCSRCEIKTCAVCKATGHEGDCPEDPDIQATLDLGAENKWQRCFSCWSLVEIEWGCNHMK
ncbi:hypothetical protein EKO04_005389 [Ascochyta lentis]|uniref:RBR-type E3 ubiquitin transferase n=1 Tax=Ascochyta lentis TaxID=205686 RepID=A0A8H7J5D8_9PLEO|nr:hypothetical protein EKO04_005389 [Ascochyta lentis]